VLGVFIVI